MTALGIESYEEGIIFIDLCGVVRGGQKKSGLAYEAVTRVLDQLE